MDSNKVNQLMVFMMDKVPSEQIPLIKNQLEKLSDDSANIVQVAISQMKSPMTAFLLTFFLFAGRAYIGEISKTVIWWIMLIFGSFLFGIPWVICFIWAIIDDFRIYGATKKKNVEILNQALMMLN